MQSERRLISRASNYTFLLSPALDKGGGFLTSGDGCECVLGHIREPNIPFLLTIYCDVFCITATITASSLILARPYVYLRAPVLWQKLLHKKQRLSYQKHALITFLTGIHPLSKKHKGLLLETMKVVHLAAFNSRPLITWFSLNSRERGCK